MRRTKSILLASAAVMALGLGFSSDAKAFDDVDWVWNVDVTKTINENITITDTFDLSGLVTIEAAQINIGDVTASATLQDFENNPPALGQDGVVIVDETITVTSNFNKPVGVGNSVPNSGGGVNDDGDTPLVSTYLGGTLSEQANGFTVINDVNITGEIELEDLEGVNDAIDLPKVENIATAVANNNSVNSTVGLNLHEAQYNFGGFAMEDQDLMIPDQNDEELGLEDANPEAVAIAAALGLAYLGADVTDNPHSDLAIGLLLAGGLGAIDQGVVSADATVDGNFPGDISVQNASVENAATAVGNNISASIEATMEGDAFMVADFTQFNYADTSATALVDNVHIDNYAGFGDAGFGNCGGCVDGLVQTPIVSNVATAVGNNISVSVSNAADGVLGN